MTITAVYVFPTHPGYFDLACRFVSSYNQHPPGVDHRLVIVSNGGPPTFDMRSLTSCLNHPGVDWLEHDNGGWDIGAYQAAACSFGDCDLMVFFGASTFLNGAGWLKRMAVAYKAHGNALYGTMGNRGNGGGVHPHIRTTAFWLAPSLFNRFPMRVTQPSQRYAFEHGAGCLTDWVTAQGLFSWEVTWRSELLWNAWGSDPHGFHRGNQSSLIAGDRLCEPPYFHGMR